MGSFELPNYLLANRKRLGLSQAEVSFLIGAETGEKVCRHERFRREPSLADGLAYEAVFQRTASELFNGKYRKIERAVAERARVLLQELDGCKSTRRTERKRKVLSLLSGSEELLS